METSKLAISPKECVQGEEIPGKQSCTEETSGMQQDDEALASAVLLSAVETLPDEILVKIFLWLPFITKISVLPEVCQKWRIIASDFSVFPTTFDFRDIPAESINSSMNFIFDTMNTKENLRPTKLILPQLENEDIEDSDEKSYEEESDEVSYYDSDEYKAIVSLLERGSNLDVWKSLTKLSAPKIDITEEVFTNFISSLNSEIFTELSTKGMTPRKMYFSCRHLTKLQRFIMWDEFIEWVLVDVESLQRLDDVIGNMEYLRELRLNVRGYFQEVLTNVLKTCLERLELLTLFIRDINGIGSSFMISLGLCRKLTYLDVRLPDVKYDELSRTLSSLTQLEQLRLEAYRFTDSRRSEDSLFQELKNLRHVYLVIDNLQDKDVTDLCMNCGHCLETIDLALCNEITDTAVTSIITYCNKLVVLKVVFCMNINVKQLLEKLTENAESHLPQLVLLSNLWFEHREAHEDVLSNCLTARPQLFIMTEDNTIDKISASSVLHKILGPKCHHKKRLIRELVMLEYCIND